MLEAALRYALSPDALQRSFFSAFRFAISNHIEEVLWKSGAGPKYPKPVPKNFHPNRPLVSVEPMHIQGQLLDAEFCLRYGFSESSISALNYLYRGSRQNSLLPFLESDSFSVGNFLFRLEPGDYDMIIDFADGVTAAGYATEIRPRAPGSLLGILGLRFASAVINEIAGPMPELESLDELSPRSAPPLWVSRRTGKVFTCVCFSYMAKRAWSRQASQTEPFKIDNYDGVRLHPGLCSICSDHVPPPKVAGGGYYNAFLQRYLPYRSLFFMKMFDGIDLSLSDLKEGERLAENAARLAVGYPLIGQKWISEVTLYRTIRSLLAPRLTFHHYQGKELEGQEIDIWVPSLKLAVEFQGPQHSQALPAWGGERALVVAKERDARKRALLKRLNYHLVESSHDEQFTEETVFERIRACLPDVQTLETAPFRKRRTTSSAEVFVYEKRLGCGVARVC